MNMTTKKIHIAGMTCVNCQNKIEQKLLHTAGIEEAVVSYNEGTAKITYDSDLISLRDITAIIERLDYKVVTGQSGEQSLERLVSILIIIIALYVILQRSGLLNLLVPSQLADSTMGYGMLFVIGLLTSVHCVAMCGGINLSQCLPKGVETDRSRRAVYMPALLYNMGRVISYTVIGFVLGFAGMLLGGGSGTGVSALLQGVLKLIAGIFMVIMGINMLNIFPGLRKFNLRMPKIFSQKIRKGKLAGKGPLAVGLLNGLMPCGPLQSMQIIALASGSPVVGAVSMFLFSLGTVPLMLGLGAIVSALGKRFTHAVMRVGAVLVVVLGLAMLSQGGSLSGLIMPEQLLTLVVALSIIGVVASIPFQKSAYRIMGGVATAVLLIAVGVIWNNNCGNISTAAEANAEAQLDDGIQLVSSTLSPGKYPSITVQAGIPVKWTINAPAGSINGCNYKMLIPDYGIEYSFEEGENVIEFTPTSAGTVSYSCWMGMIYGNIFVVEGDDTANADTNTDINTETGTGLTVADVPVKAGYTIPFGEPAVAVIEQDTYEFPVQEVTIQLTDSGFEPAVVIVQENVQTIWTIVDSRENADSDILLAPFYASQIPLGTGENPLYLYPTESFDVYTGDNAFFAYVKVVEDIGQLDMSDIENEVNSYETIIYPESIYDTSDSADSCCSTGTSAAAAAASCCGGDTTVQSSCCN